MTFRVKPVLIATQNLIDSRCCDNTFAFNHLFFHRWKSRLRLSIVIHIGDAQPVLFRLYIFDNLRQSVFNPFVFRMDVFLYRLVFLCIYFNETLIVTFTISVLRK